MQEYALYQVNNYRVPRDSRAPPRLLGSDGTQLHAFQF
jgi:hypothetical protein